MALEGLTDRGALHAAGNGIAFLISVEVVAALVAKACSSPQTTELNAKKRSPTLMKWVNLGMLEAGAVLVIAAWMAPPLRPGIIAGGLIEGGITYAQYLHARKAGLSSDQPGTESY